MKTFIILLFPLLFLLPHTSQAQEKTERYAGTISFLRVNETGIVYGPPTDNIAAEVIVKIAGNDNSYGFQLRKDANEIAHLGMLNLLRDAFINNLKVELTYKIRVGKKVGRIIVVGLKK